MNIILIGMMGSGKSTVGRALAAKVGACFVDLDAEVEEEEGMSVLDIFEARGEKVFRQLESEALRRVCMKWEAFSFRAPSESDDEGHIDEPKVALVVAAGGGAPVYGDNMIRMKKLGKVVYLRASVDELLTRVSACSVERPMLKGGDVRERLVALLDERRGVYEQADATIDVDGRQVKEVVSDLVALARGWQ